MTDTELICVYLDDSSIQFTQDERMRLYNLAGMSMTKNDIATERNQIGVRTHPNMRSVLIARLSPELQVAYKLMS
jgi:hypothetical protein